jgi:hypothetical protein
MTVANPVVCPPNTWTEIAPANFGQAMIRFGSGALRIEFAATKPIDANAGAGIAVDYNEIQDMPMGVYPLRTGSAANAIYGRPVGSNAITVERLF